jgi:hypothetical protein
MEGDSNTLPSTASVEAQQNERQSLTNCTRLLQPTPLRNFGLCTLSAPYTATTQTSSHLQKIPFSKPSCRTALRSSKQVDTTVPYNTALTMVDTPIHLPSKSNEESQTKTPTLKSLLRINKLSDATPTSLSVTRASQGKGAIRDFGEFNPPHRVQKMRKWTIISKEQDNKMHRCYARRFMFKDAPSTAPTKTVTENVTNKTPQGKPFRLGWGTPHHNVGINLPSHPTYVALNPAAYEPTHISPPEVAAKPLSEYCLDASNNDTDNEYYNFAEGGFY